MDTGAMSPAEGQKAFTDPGGVSAAHLHEGDPLPMLRPPCGKMNDSRLWPRGVQGPAPPSAPYPNMATGKGIESSLRRSDCPSPRRPPASPRHGAGAAYPEESRELAPPVAPGTVLTPRPPSDGVARRKVGASRREKSSDSFASSGKPTGTMLPPVPLTARERSVRSPEESLGGSGSSSFSARQRSDRSGSQRTRTSAQAPQKAPSSARRENSERRKEQEMSQNCEPASPDSTWSARPGQRSTPNGRESPSSAGERSESVGHAPQRRKASDFFLANFEDGMLSLNGPDISESKEASNEGEPASSFQSIMEQMERDRELYEEKTIALATGGSRPGTSTASASTAAVSMPSTADVAPPAQDLEPLEPPEAQGDLSEAAQLPVDDSLAPQPTQGSIGEVAQVSESPLADEPDMGESLIAAALREAGFNPDSVAVSDLMGLEESPLETEESPLETVSEVKEGGRWQKSSKSWAAERAKRKKERYGLRSGAATPCSSAGRATPAPEC
eukprot:TRINITY_DN14601_c0_g1_i2.p1 TRINITY_DN14601_c0_g1~~TRINITY_DN14601_c0_g1_i2.p1  ORF type:complete len:502 (+),score=73.49 TRINITY_DN14601_c0_g1_i2:23-1528(+)